VTYTYMNVVRMTTEAWFAFFAFLMMLLMHYDSRNMVIDKRRRALVLSLPVIVLFMIGDIFAVYYRGDPSGLGYWMVRLGNGVYFLAGLVLVELLGEYLGVQVAETGEETYSMAFKWINRSPGPPRDRAASRFPVYGSVLLVRREQPLPPGAELLVSMWR